MTFQALKGQSIIEYKKPDEYEILGSGVGVMAEHVRRELLRRQEKKIIDVRNPPPDIIRQGTIVVGDQYDCPPGTIVYFNRHDADHFEWEEKEYYRIPNEFLLMAYLP